MDNALDVNLIITRLVSETPLVIAFILFSIKIITIYQSAQRETVASYQLAQEKLADINRAAQKDQSERTEKMILTITSQWSLRCDQRDGEMREFLKTVRDQDNEILGRLSEDIRANTQALHLLQISQTQSSQQPRKGAV